MGKAIEVRAKKEKCVQGVEKEVVRPGAGKQLSGIQ